MGEQASTAASTGLGGETVVHGYRSGYGSGVRGGRVREHGRERRASETAERIGLSGKGQRQGANRSVERACAERARAKARLREAVGRARAAARQGEAASRVA